MIDRKLRTERLENTACSPYRSNNRFIHSLLIASAGSQRPDGPSMCELDSHADTCVAGPNCVQYEPADRTVTVHAYSNEYKPIPQVPVVTAATVWTCQDTGQDYLILIHESLFLGNRVESTLLNPNQMRAYGTMVDDVPVQFEPSSTHSICAKDEYGDTVYIPLSMQGVISGFESRKPTPKELDTLPKVALTSPTTWDPCSESFAVAEEAALASPHKVAAARATLYEHDSFELVNQHRLCGAVSSYHTAIEGTYDNFEADVLHSKVCGLATVARDDLQGDGLDGFADEQVYGDTAVRIASAKTSSPSPIITPEILSRRWNIGIDTAKRTLRATTQTGVRNILAPAERRVRKKAPWLKFPNLRSKFFWDSMHSKVPDIHGRRGASIFTNGIGYDCFYPHEKESHSSQDLMSFIHDVGVPQTLVSDGAKALIHGNSRDVLDEYRIQTKITVPYSPWQNAAESSVRECKKGIRMAIRRSNAPRRTWGYCGKWVTAIRRLTAHNNDKLDGRVPAESIEGSTIDISAYAMFDWYQDVFYYEPRNQFPYQRKHVGKWLGMADVATDSLCYWILPKSGIPVMRKDVWGLTVADRSNPSIHGEIASL